MSIETTKLPWLVVVSSLLALVWTGTGGCQSDVPGCRSDADCKGRRVCMQGQCLPPEGERDVGGATADGSDGVERKPDGSTIADGSVGGDARSDPSVDTEALDAESRDRDSTAPPPDSSADVGPDGQDPGDVVPSGDPRLRIRPERGIQFGGILETHSVDKKVYIENTGGGRLRIQRLGLRETPSSGFSVTSPSSSTILGGETAVANVTFDPTKRGQYRNMLVVETNAANQQSPKELELRAIAGPALSRVCLYAAPEILDLGIVEPMGTRTADITLGNCGQSSEVTVTGFEWDDNPENAFQLGAGAPSPPFTMSKGETKQIPVEFVSTSLRTLTGELLVRNTEPSRAPESVTVRGSGGGCPEADLRGGILSPSQSTPRDGPFAVAPGDTLGLTGGGSTSPSERIAYDWSVVTRPSGSTLDVSGKTSSEIQLSPNVPGLYEVRLEVSDPVSGQKGCVTDTLEFVRLRRAPAFDAELTWRADHDLDLYLMRQKSDGSFSEVGARSNDVLGPEQDLRNWGSSGRRTDDGVHTGDSGPGGRDRTRKSEQVVLGALKARRYRLIVHFDESDGVDPEEFNARATMNVNGNSRTLGRRFRRSELDDVWIVFEIDGSTGKITEIDRRETRP